VNITRKISEDALRNSGDFAAEGDTLIRYFHILRFLRTRPTLFDELMNREFGIWVKGIK
jgi:hypothetical protein